MTGESWRGPRKCFPLEFSIVLQCVLGSLLKRWISYFLGSEKLQSVQFSCVFEDTLGMSI